MRLIGPVLLTVLGLIALSGCADEPSPTIAAGPPPTTAPTSVPPTADATFGDQTATPATTSSRASASRRR